MTYPPMATTAWTIPKITSRIAPSPLPTAVAETSSTDPSVPSDTIAPAAPPTDTAATASRDRSLPGRNAANASKPAISSSTGT